MNRDTKQLAIGLAVASAFGLAQPASAQSGIKANIGHVGDGNGIVVRDGQGNCVRTIEWTPALALEGCGGPAAPRKAAAGPAAKPAPVAVAPAPAPRPEPVMERVTLKAGALFDTGRADLKPAGQRELDELAARLKTMQGIDSVQITGHTDSQGQAASNQGLSERRAEAVKAYLVGKGVDGQRISTRGLGASSPVASNATAEGRARNRRVELEIKATQQAP